MKVLVIGYGSIGARHARVLASMDNIREVVVLSSQPNLPYPTIVGLDEILSLDPDYIVIASVTSKHYEQLVFIEKNCRNKIILVEKPLFAQEEKLEIINNTVFVGYTLRFNPTIQFIKEQCSGKKLWSINAFCGSYLPEWRPGRDYRSTSSASKEKGGGVLLDLSHELDYIQWITGGIQLNHVVSRKISDLEIDTDDQLLLTATAEGYTYIQLSLNYFSRKPIRQLFIDGEGISIVADLINKKVFIDKNSEKNKLSWPDSGKESILEVEHEAVLSNDKKYLCTFKEAIEVMSLIDKIQHWN